MKRFVLLAMLLSLAGATGAMAVEFPTVALHVNSVIGKNQCTAIDPLCDEIVTNGPVVDGSPDASYNVYMMANINQGEAVRGVELGIWYIGEFDDSNLTEGINVLSWTSCSDVEFPSADWPAPNSVNTITFSPSACDARPDSTTNVAILGNFYVTAYSSSLMQTIPRPNNGKYTISDCSGGEIPMTWPDAAGWVSFGSRPEGMGCIPCVAPCTSVPVEANTWGNIKKNLGKR